MDHGLWYARSADFLQQPHIQVLRWLRAIGDTIFAAGVVSLVYFVIGLRFGWSLQKDPRANAEEVGKGGRATARG
jgi:nitric oxide reductase subunit B